MLILTGPGQLPAQRLSRPREPARFAEFPWPAEQRQQLRQPNQPPEYPPLRFRPWVCRRRGVPGRKPAPAAARRKGVNACVSSLLRYLSRTHTRGLRRQSYTICPNYANIQQNNLRNNRELGAAEGGQSFRSNIMQEHAPSVSQPSGGCADARHPAAPLRLSPAGFSLAKVRDLPFYFSISRSSTSK